MDAKTWTGTASSRFSNFSGADLLPRVGQVGDGLHGEACRNVKTASRRLQTLASSEAYYAPRADYLDAVQTQGMTESWRVKITAWCAAASCHVSLRVEIAEDLLWGPAVEGRRPL